MNQSFSPFKLLEKVSLSHYTGQLTVSSQDITWIIELHQGNLKSAVHSLQSLPNLELCLYSLGYGQKTAQIIQVMAQNGFNEKKGNNFIEEAISYLMREETIGLSQQLQLINQFTQDALEPFFFLETANYYSSQNKSSVVSSEQGFNVEELCNLWKKKQQAWQKFSPLINSPHQRPYCPNLQTLKNSLVSKSSNLLAKIASFKGKISIRQLGILLKLDDCQVAELLYPYLKSKVLRLHSPLSPFDKLPPISSSDHSLTANNPLPKKSNTTTQTQQIKENNQCHKVFCIDDSETILNTFKRYLSSDNIDLYMLSNPSLAINKLFEIKPDLLLVDIAMPGINGDQLSKILKRSTAFKNLPIIIVSADTNKIEEAQAKGNVANDFLQKPFTQSDLMGVVNKYL